MAFLDIMWLGNPLLAYIKFISAIVGGIILGKIFYWISKNIIKKITEKTETRLDDLLIETLERPAVFLLFAIGFRVGYSFLILNERATTIFGNISLILFSINIAWFVMNILDAFIVNYLEPASKKSKNDIDDMLIPLIRKAVKGVIILITLVMIIDNFGYDVTSLVAGLGLGGLAFALAAQDLLSNLFGGVAILSDKPFKVGNRIIIDQKHDGFVREIGIRSTRMETFDGTFIVVPNSLIAKTILENISLEQARRIKTTISISYETSDKKLAEAKKIIAEIIKQNKKTNGKSVACFEKFGDYALELTVIYWLPDVEYFFSAKDEINTEIKKRFDKAKIEFAYPTQVVHLKK